MTARWAWAVAAALCSHAAFALEVVAEGEAAIVNADRTLARQVALRRAMTAAAEQGGGRLQSTTLASAAGIQENTSFSPQGRVLGARILAEHVERGRLRVTAEVRLEEAGRAEQCVGRPLRKALVASFPLRYPEQMRSGEYVDWPQATAAELAQRVNRRGRLLASALLHRFPFASLEAAPEPERLGGQSAMARWAAEARAQYAVAGIIKDFGVASAAYVLPQRQLAIEAYIYDGISGELLARREFARQLTFSWQMPKTIAPGTREFADSRLGKLYYEILDDIGDWAEATIACLPFSARVLRAEGRRIILDAGSDSGIEPGMELLLTRGAGDGRAAPSDAERLPLAGAIVRSVQARHSVAETTAGKDAPAVRGGDVAFGL